MSTNSEHSDSRTLDVADVSEIDDPRRPLTRALRLGAWALVALTVVSLMAWGGLYELQGIWGALMGAAVGGGFVLLTALSVLLTSGTSPANTMAVVLGGWLLKMVVLVIVLLLIRDLTFYNHLAFGVTTIAALVIVLAAEAWGVITTRVSYVS
ncbi:hypothetical protein [Corynebacterium lipophiloflavum]|uniref:ATP synthase protein I n=1 Tax=Corynebacterium lipophiloflavum (strain ATCC 700352 / DSM 44291 / CCUG 37336 / JCM 10383 / DMMZ 1944) TaxID=525263 RepID=C0XPE0_CORLD|nr:hypothetical protein [Corynebacterium lipophiloflavum]EEI17874.1 hypothetical protein HMPREF0298_0318 [Corynebacterium lipophiloflavum DSM 44291]